ncbi:MAG: hypothetical protein ACXVRJ_05675 [Gaiellaceae bacterium]
MKARLVDELLEIDVSDDGIGGASFGRGSRATVIDRKGSEKHQH